MERCQQLQLNELISENSCKNERRNSPRYTMHENVWFVSKDVSAEVVDISESGMSLRYLASVDKPPGKIVTFELLNFELKTSFKGGCCRLVRSSNKAFSPASPATMIIHFSLEFMDLTQIKCKQLLQFIQDGERSGIKRENLVHDTSKKREFSGKYSENEADY